MHIYSPQPQVIFRSGEGALQVLPQLLGVVPEARLNLAIYHLRHGKVTQHNVCTAPTTIIGSYQIHADWAFILIVCLDNIEDAYALICDLEPSSPQEYILKAVANTVVGQEHGSVSPSPVSSQL